MARSSDVLDLAVEGKQEKKSRKKLIVGIAMLGVIPVIGSTLAASITLNSGGSIEFGQGQVAVTACDDFTVELISTYTTSNFYLQQIRLTGIDTTATSSGTTGCAGESFSVIARNSSGSALSGGTVTFTLPASGTTISTVSGATAAITTGATASDTVTLTLSTTTVPAADVSKVTVETS